MAIEKEELVVILSATFEEFGRQMAAAEKKGTKTYQKLVQDSAKASSAMEFQILRAAETQGRALDRIYGQSAEAAKRAKDSAAAFREFERGRVAVDQLRASLDPVFAATLRYTQAVERLDAELARGVITEKEHAQTLALVKAQYDSIVPVADRQSGAMARLGDMSNATKAKIQGVGFQVQDMAVQMAGGTAATTALAQQLPQLLGNFGLVGIAVGTLASVGIPLLSAVFGSAEGDGQRLSKSMTALQNSVQAMNDAANAYTAEGLEAMRQKYGAIDQSVLNLIEHQRQFAVDRAEADAAASVKALADQYNALSINLDAVGLAAKGPQLAIYNMSKSLGLTTDQTRELVRAMQDVASATTYAGRAEALSRVASILQVSTAKASDLTKAVIDGEAAMKQLANAVPKAGWLAAAIGQANTLGEALWEAVRAKAKLAEEAAKPGMDTGSGDWAKNDLGFTLPGSELVPQQPKKTGGGGGRGGGGGGKPDTGWLDSLIQDLQTEREVVEAWYAEDLASISRASDAQLAAIGGRHEAMERLETEHQERLRGIRDGAQGGTLAHAETFFGAMATLTAAGGEKMAKAARATAAAEALINVYRAQAQVLADPKLGFWAKLPAMAAIGTAGMNVVSALGGSGKSKGGGSSGGGSGSSGGGSTSTAQAPQSPLILTLQGIDPNKFYEGAAIVKLADDLQKEFGKRGLQVGYST